MLDTRWESAVPMALERATTASSANTAWRARGGTPARGVMAEAFAGAVTNR
jgi:hypothetical protein